MKTSKKTYRVVCKTDHHEPNKHYYNGELCKPEWRGLTLREANELLFKFLKEDVNLHFANWGLAVVWSKRLYRTRNVICYTNSDGTRVYNNGLCKWRVERENRIRGVKMYPTNAYIDTYDGVRELDFNFQERVFADESEAEEWLINALEKLGITYDRYDDSVLILNRLDAWTWHDEDKED